MNIAGKQLTNVLTRNIHTTFVMWNLKKQSAVMNKLMNIKGKAKRKWYEPPENTLPTMKNLSKTSHMTGKTGLRRTAMLNKLFMKNVTDLLCVGSLSHEILGKGLEISKVSITPDFHILRVFWVCTDSKNAAEVEQVLNRTAGSLRHELSQLRLMGDVPTVVFVKDEQCARLREIDEKLAIADYGEDYEPKTIGYLLKADFTLNTKLPPEVMSKIQELEASEELDEDPVPTMTHNVYGLDHLAMTNRMRAARRTNDEAWTRRDEPGVSRRENVVSYTTTGQKPQNYSAQRKELTEFLHKRQIEQNKLHKMALSRDMERNVVFEVEEREEHETCDTDEGFLEEEDYDEFDDDSHTRR